jgi:hypothetical protein
VDPTFRTSDGSGSQVSAELVLEAERLPDWQFLFKIIQW